MSRPNLLLFQVVQEALDKARVPHCWLSHVTAQFIIVSGCTRGPGQGQSTILLVISCHGSIYYCFRLYKRPWTRPKYHIVGYLMSQLNLLLFQVVQEALDKAKVPYCWKSQLTAQFIIVSGCTRGPGQGQSTTLLVISCRGSIYYCLRLYKRPWTRPEYHIVGYLMSRLNLLLFQVVQEALDKARVPHCWLSHVMAQFIIVLDCTRGPGQGQSTTLLVISCHGSIYYCFRLYKRPWTRQEYHIVGYLMSRLNLILFQVVQEALDKAQVPHCWLFHVTAQFIIVSGCTRGPGQGQSTTLLVISWHGPIYYCFRWYKRPWTRPEYHIVGNLMSRLNLLLFQVVQEALDKARVPHCWLSHVTAQFIIVSDCTRGPGQGQSTTLLVISCHSSIYYCFRLYKRPWTRPEYHIVGYLMSRLNLLLFQIVQEALDKARVPHCWKSQVTAQFIIVSGCTRGPGQGQSTILLVISCHGSIYYCFRLYKRPWTRPKYHIVGYLMSRLNLLLLQVVQEALDKARVPHCWKSQVTAQFIIVSGCTRGPGQGQSTTLLEISSHGSIYYCFRLYKRPWTRREREEPVLSSPIDSPQSRTPTKYVW